MCGQTFYRVFLYITASIITMQQEILQEKVLEILWVDWDSQIYLNKHFIQHYALQWNLSIKDTLNKGHLSNEDTVYCPMHIEAVYKSTSELGTPLYTGHQAGSQWCPL